MKVTYFLSHVGERYNANISNIIKKTGYSKGRSLAGERG
jgi:hypothetical protein